MSFHAIPAIVGALARTKSLDAVHKEDTIVTGWMELEAR